MGQRIASRLDVQDANVHAEFDLPAFLAMFGNQLRAMLQKEGPKLLEYRHTRYNLVRPEPVEGPFFVSHANHSGEFCGHDLRADRKSTRLNSSHSCASRMP